MPPLLPSSSPSTPFVPVAFLPFLSSSTSSPSPAPFLLSSPSPLLISLPPSLLFPSPSSASPHSSLHPPLFYLSPLLHCTASISTSPLPHLLLVSSSLLPSYLLFFVSSSLLQPLILGPPLRPPLPRPPPSSLISFSPLPSPRHSLFLLPFSSRRPLPFPILFLLRFKFPSPSSPLLPSLLPLPPPLPERVRLRGAKDSEGRARGVDQR